MKKDASDLVPSAALAFFFAMFATFVAAAFSSCALTGGVVRLRRAGGESDAPGRPNTSTAPCGDASFLWRRPEKRRARLGDDLLLLRVVRAPRPVRLAERVSRRSRGERRRAHAPGLRGGGCRGEPAPARGRGNPLRPPAARETKSRNVERGTCGWEAPLTRAGLGAKRSMGPGARTPLRSGRGSAAGE